MKPLNLLPKYLLISVLVGAPLMALAAYTLNESYNESFSRLVQVGIDARRDASIDQRIGSSREISEYLALSIAAPVAGGDQETLEGFVSQFMSLHGTQAIVVAAPDGSILAASGAQTADSPPFVEAVEETVADLSQNVITVRTPIIHLGAPIGTLLTQQSIERNIAEMRSIEGSLAAISAELRRENYVRSILLILGFVVTITLTVAIIVIRSVRSIRAVIRATEQLGRGDFGKRLEAKRTDELGQLAQAFNRMRDTLRATTISRNYLDDVLGSMNDAILVTTPGGIITRANHAATRLLASDEDELIGQPVTSIIAPEVRDRFQLEDTRARPLETRLISAQGDEVPISYTLSKIESDDSATQGCILAAQNITDRKKAEQRIRYLARIDALTKVPNRMQFQHLLQRSIARARRQQDQIALLYLDVDRFKDINDTYGHASGDAVLETLTDRLTKLLPNGTVLGRLAGDEFAVILDSLAAGEEARNDVAARCRRILQSLSEVLVAQGHQIHMTASIGIAFYPADAGNVIDLIRNADAALYHTKRQGGNTFSFYHPDMNAEAVERLMLKSKLRRSYENHELLLHYQPKFDLRSGAVVGAEALVRWELPERGIVLPSEFIPLAEETNLILEIGEWVLDRVCADYKLWQKHIAIPGRISVNLSLKQLRQPTFLTRISAVFRKHDVSPTCFEFEITETTLMEDPERTIDILNQLSDMGLHLAIDDFGTGYSSLSALQQFPISTLKIDKSFVRDAATDADDATIVATIIDMGRSLNMDVVAEGVEAEEQLSFLKTLQCNYVQGLLFGDPMSADSFEALLTAQADGNIKHIALFA